MIADTKKLFIIYAIVLVIALWFSGIVPRQIGKITAIVYVRENYPQMNMEYSNIEYSPFHESYFVSFKASDGGVYNFQVVSRFFPVRVWFDPLKLF